VEGAGAGAVEDDVAGGEEGVELAGDDALEEGELVGVVSVEGGAVDGGGFGDVLHGNLFEFLGSEEVNEALLEKLAGAADARVEILRGLELGGHEAIGL